MITNEVKMEDKVTRTVNELKRQKVLLILNEIISADQ